MRRILLADDDPNARKLLVEQLQGAGYELDVARDGIEALAKARNRHPDLIITDLMMPRMDGFMLLRQWRGDAGLRGIPVIVATATFTEPEDENLVRDLGADHFLIKPVDAESLIACIESSLGQDNGDTQRLLSVPSGNTGVLKAYNERLGRKLHSKMRQLEHTRQVIRDGDDLYSSLFRNNHSPMLLIDPEDDAIVDVNPAAASFYGWSREEMRELTADAINELPPDAIAAELEKASAERRNYFLFRHRRADGSVRDVEVYSGPITVRGRHLLYSIVHDITDRREAESRLRRTESLVRIASTLARVGGWEVDLDSERMTWSDEVARIHGRSAGITVSINEAMGFCAPEYRQKMREVFQSCVDDGIPYDEELQILRADGSRLWVRTVGEPVRDANGRIVGVHGALQDVDSQVHAREELRQLWLAVEQSPESILITDLAPRILFVNDACCRISGYSRAELVGQNPRVLRSGKTPSETIAALWQSLRAGRSWSGVMHNRRKDGTEYVESATINPVRQADGRITHYLAIKEDITERRRTEHELKRYRDHLEELVEQRTGELAEARRQAEHANQAKSAFLANMSHEIRTPLNGVLGTLDVLEAQTWEEDRRELIATIRESGRSLIRLIEDILDFSRIEAGRLTLERAEFSVEEAVEGLCESLVQMANDRGVDLHVFVAPDVPRRLVGDEVRLRQILYNLVGNGIKFSGGRSEVRGRVRLSVERSPTDPDRYRFTIEDNGIGISEEARKRLFQPFSQAEASTTRRFGGSGLGLVICQRLVELYGGRIALQSAVGRGTTFDVDLPLSVASKQPVAESGDLAGCHCVIVEDEAVDADTLETYLVAAGARVTRWPDAGTAASAHTEEPRGAIVLCRRDHGPAIEKLITSAAGCVYFARGATQRPRVTQSGAATISPAALRRRSLLDAVRIVTGRSSESAGRGDVDEAIHRAPEPPSKEEARARGRLILVAEDDEIGRQVIGHQLRLLGHAAEIAKDGRQALELWRRGDYALLLTDLHMPELDGYELTSAIRREEKDKDAGSEGIPIIALTANALRGEADRAERKGMNGYITKPLQLARLRQVLATYLAEDEPANGAAVAENDAINDYPVFDPVALAEVIDDDGEVVTKFLNDYLRSAEGLVKDFRRACDASDMGQAAAIAHKLKSSSRAVGALSLGALCERIEKRGRAGDAPRCCTTAGELNETFEIARLAIAEHIGRTT